MMVNRITRTLFLLLVILFEWIPQANAQHSGLTIRVDTLTIQSTDNDVLIGVYQKLTGHKAIDFYGYDARISYDTTKLRATGVFFQGTASEYLSYKIANTQISGSLRVEALGQTGQGVDTTNPLLFLVRFSVLSRSFDTTFLTLYRFDTTSSPMIDTLRLVSGWIRHQPPGKPPVKIPMTLSTAHVDALSDSTVVVPIQVTDLTHANLRYGTFSCRIDTAVLHFLGSTPGKITGDSLRTKDSINGSTIRVHVSNADTNNLILGSGTLLNLLFHVSKRRDTVCTVLSDTAFTGLNLDALIDTVNLHFSTICDLGRLDSQRVVRMNSTPISGSLHVRPNPLPMETSLLIETVQKGECELRIFDPVGREVFVTNFQSHYDWKPSTSLATGAYLIRVRAKSAKGDSEEIGVVRIR